MAFKSSLQARPPQEEAKSKSGADSWRVLPRPPLKFVCRSQAAVLGVLKLELLDRAGGGTLQDDVAAFRAPSHALGGASTSTSTSTSTAKGKGKGTMHVEDGEEAEAEDEAEDEDEEAALALRNRTNRAGKQAGGRAAEEPAKAGRPGTGRRQGAKRGQAARQAS